MPYSVSFFGDYENYPTRIIGDYPTQAAAIIASEADLRTQARAGRKYYNDLCYYSITEYNDEGEAGNSINADEVAGEMLPNVGDFVRVVIKGKVRHGEIIAVDPRENRRYFVVAEFTKTCNTSSNQRRWHYLAIDGLSNAVVYQRFQALNPSENGPIWIREIVPIK